MTYRELYESAINKLEKSEITLGEFERMIKPLNAEIATDINVGDKDTISRKAAIDGKIYIQRSNGVEIYDDYAVPVEYLEQLPPSQPEQLGTNLAEVGTDCISRHAAIKATWQDTGYTDPFNVMTAIRDRIQQLPPAQPERIRGHWICDRGWSEGVGMGESYGHYWKCDKCGHLEQGDWSECGCNFCSNCGSDNREVTT